MTTTPLPTTVELWTFIKKEITGIQMLWEVVNSLYFQPKGKVWQAFACDAPLFVHLTQTAMMESLLMRVSRLLDPAATGRGQSQMTNLSLKSLVEAEPRIAADEQAIRTIWDVSGLVAVRNKYLSHNDLTRSVTADHTLNIPLESKDIEALQELAIGLRKLRRDVNSKLGAGTYLDQGLDAQSQYAVEVLCKTLQGGKLFFELLPDQPVLQQALVSVEAQQCL